MHNVAYLGAGYAHTQATFSMLTRLASPLATHNEHLFRHHSFCKISTKKFKYICNCFFSFFWTIETEQGKMALNWWQHAAIYCYCWRKRTCVRWKEEGGTIPLLENRFELILRGLIRAGSSHTMSPAAKIKTRSGQIYAMPTIGQVGQSENRCGSGQKKKIMNKRKHRKDCKCCPGHYLIVNH